MSPPVTCDTLPASPTLHSSHAPPAFDTPRAEALLPDCAASLPVPCLSSLYDGRVQPYRTRIRGYLRRHVDEESAEDLTQDVMLAAWRSLPRLHDLQALERWLFCVAAHHVASFHRRRACQASPLSLAALTGEQMLAQAAQEPASASCDCPSVLTGYAPPAACDAVLRGVEARLWAEELLKQAQAVCSQAQCAVLRGYYAGASFEEIGAHMRVDSATVRSHFRRARACLLSHLFEHAPDLAGGPQGIAGIAQWLGSEAAGALRLSAPEREALRDPCRHVKRYRAVCLKIARHLPIPL